MQKASKPKAVKLSGLCLFGHEIKAKGGKIKANFQKMYVGSRVTENFSNR